MNNKNRINMMTFHAKRLFLLFVLGLTFAVNSFAADWYTDSNNLYYLIDKDNHTAILYPHDYTGDINIPANVTIEGTSYKVIALADNCFKNCEIGNVTIPNSVKKLGTACFQNSKLSSITIPNSVIELGAYCFNACSYLTSITIPNSIKELPTHCFYNASLSTGISLPNTINKIGNSCFYACRFTNIELPSSVTEIGDSTFMNCAELTSIKFPENLKKISYYCLHQCKKITEIELPKTLEIIEDGSFCYCSSLEQISIPSTVKEMNCFRKNSGNTTSIGIFSFCSKLKQITIPSSVTTLGYRIFGSCYSLESITIGSGVNSIDEKAFSGCSGIKEIKCYAVKPPKTTNDPFGDIKLYTSTLYVPKGYETKYKSTNYWNGFKTISTLDTPEPGIEPLTTSFTDEAPSPEIPEGTYYAGNLTYTRTGSGIKIGNYGTFCLPFDINLDEIDCFSNVYIPINMALYNPDKNQLTILLDKASKTDIIKAGQPFLAKLAVNNTVAISNSSTIYISQNYANQDMESTFKVYNFNGTAGALFQNVDLDVKFGGTFKKMTDLDGEIYKTFGPSGGFSNGTSVNTFRAYVKKANLASQLSVQSITWGVGDETTGIKYIVTPKQDLHNNKVYTLDGKLVNEIGDTKSLKQGIYIKNGHKIIIK